MKKKTGMRSLYTTLLLVVLIWMLTGCIVTTPLEPHDLESNWAPDNKQVVFVCYRRQSTMTSLADKYLGPYTGTQNYKYQEICTSNIYGSNRKQLTDNDYRDYGPSWSPDGINIAFVSNVDNSDQSTIYIMKSDGTNLRKLTESPTDNIKLNWSPDGHAISFIQGNFGGNLNLSTLDSGQTISLSENIGVLSYDWSPDGEYLVFDGGGALSQEIFIVDLEKNIITQMTGNNELDSEPRWSPDGGYIIYNSGGQAIVQNVETREQMSIPQEFDAVWSVSWSPNGKFISLVSGRGHEQVLYILDSETKTIHHSFSNFQIINIPHWSPNSQYLLFERLEDWNEDGYSESKIWITQISNGLNWAVSSE